MKTLLIAMMTVISACIWLCMIDISNSLNDIRCALVDYEIETKQDTIKTMPSDTTIIHLTISEYEQSKAE